MEEGEDLNDGLDKYFYTHDYEGDKCNVCDKAMKLFVKIEKLPPYLIMINDSYDHEKKYMKSALEKYPTTIDMKKYLDKNIEDPG